MVASSTLLIPNTWAAASLPSTATAWRITGWTPPGPTTKARSSGGGVRGRCTSMRFTNTNTGFGECQFTAAAYGDLDDDDTLFSTYERAGAADQQGVNAAAGLYIDQEVE